MSELPERILDKIAFEPITGCWLWTAIKGHTGYAQVGIGKRTGARAHKVIYEMLIGPVPKGLELDHLCRTRACVNPYHLEPVTHQQNMRRGFFGSKQTCPQGHAYNEQNTRILIDKTNLPRRDCRVCKNQRERERYARRLSNVP